VAGPCPELRPDRQLPWIRFPWGGGITTCGCAMDGRAGREPCRQVGRGDAAAPAFWPTSALPETYRPRRPSKYVQIATDPGQGTLPRLFPSCGRTLASADAGVALDGRAAFRPQCLKPAYRQMWRKLVREGRGLMASPVLIVLLREDNREEAKRAKDREEKIRLKTIRDPSGTNGPTSAHLRSLRFFRGKNFSRRRPRQPPPGSDNKAVPHARRPCVWQAAGTSLWHIRRSRADSPNLAAKHLVNAWGWPTPGCSVAGQIDGFLVGSCFPMMFAGKTAGASAAVDREQSSTSSFHLRSLVCMPS